MRGLTFTLFILLFAISGYSQTTYYWIGGTGPVSFTANNNWNTQLDGLGTSRSVAGDMVTDILIFDGTNVGGTVPTTGNVVVTSSTDTCARLVFQNSVNVQFSRTGTGSANINLQGDGTALDDLVVEAGSTVTLGGDAYNFDVRFILGLPTVPASIGTGSINGNIYLSPLSASVHTASYITSKTANGLVFEPGANLYVTDSLTVSPFNGSATGTVLFKTGSSLHYYTGRSPFGNAAAVQFANFEPGSNFYVHKINRSYLDGVSLYASSSWTNTKSFANIFIQDGATLFSDGTIYRIDNLTIDNACTFSTHTSGHTPVLGDLTVNGTLTFPSGSNTLLIGGNVPQTISGSGTISIPNFVVADYSQVSLSKSIDITSSTNIVGDINFGTSGQITGAGTFTARVASTPVVGTATTTAGSYQVTFTGPSGINGYSISGTGIPANTNVVGFGTSANLVYMSKPATASGSVTVTFASDTASLQTANPNGFDALTGSVINAGNQSFQAGTNYIVDAATANPFGISTTAGSNITVGNVLLNASVTTNYYCRIAGILTLANGKLTIRPADTVRILSGAPIGGAPFSSSKYIVSEVSGNNLGVLRIDNLPTSTTLFPVGTASYYMPVSVTPSSTADHAVSVFEGVTEDGTPTGTPFSAAKKAQVVDAVWIIDRPTGSGDCIIDLQWDAALEGSSFVSYPGVSLGVSRHDGTAWGISLGAGDNAANNATALYSNFSPFGVGYNGAVLASQVKNISAYIRSNSVEINWYVTNEAGIVSYEIEKSTNGNDFSKTGTVHAAGKDKYEFTDPASFSGVIYYRIKIISLSGQVKYSEIVSEKKTGKTEISLYPNPAANSITLSGLVNASVYKIINAAGQLVVQQKTTANSVNIDVSNLKGGFYFIEILSNDNTSVKQSFIKQ